MTIDGSGDVFFDSPVYSSGLVGGVQRSSVEGGVVRQATSLILPWSYVQSYDPDDPGIGTALLVDWDVVIDGASTGWGPQVSTGWFGPRATIEAEGNVRFGTDMTAFSFAPIAFGDLVRIANVKGQNRVLNTAWSHMSSPMVIADAGEVTLAINDTNWGGAAFVDTKAYVTTDGGSIDGLAHGAGPSTVLSRLVLLGNVDLHHRFGFEFHDTNSAGPFTGALGQGQGGGTQVDPYGQTDPVNASIGDQVAVWIGELGFGDRNAGIVNGSRLVNTPVDSSLAAAGDSIRSDASSVHVVASAALELTSTPSVAAGQFDGQELVIANVGANPVTLRSEVDLTGSGLALASPRRKLEPGGSVRLHWNGDSWIESPTHSEWFSTDESPSTPWARTVAEGVRVTRYSSGQHTVDLASTPGSSIRFFKGSEATPRMACSSEGLALTDGVDGVNGTYLQRPSKAHLRLRDFAAAETHVLEAGHAQQVNVQAGASYTVVDADRGRTIVRTSGGAPTQTWPRDTGASTLEVGQMIYVLNVGSGTVTHQAGSGATLYGQLNQPTNTWFRAMKLAADTWAIAPG